MGKNNKLFILFVLLIFVYPNICFGLTDDCLPKNENNLSEEEEEWLNALKNTAYAFYNRGEALQYDGSAITFNGGVGAYGSGRSDYYYAPEEANMQYKLYSVCSGFIYRLFYNTFSKNNTNYVINGNRNSYQAYVRANIATPYLTLISNPNNSTYYNDDLAIFYIDSNSYYKNDNGIKTTSLPDYFVNGKYPSVGSDGKYSQSKTDKLREDILSVIKPGDFIVYKQGNTGHVVVYLGNNMIMESFYSGANAGIYDFSTNRDKLENIDTLKDNSGYAIKNFDNTPATGTIHTWNLNNCDSTNSTNHSVLGDNYRNFSTSAESIAIVRPFNEIKKEGYQISEAAKTRNIINSLYVEKTVSTGYKGSTGETKYNGRYLSIYKNGFVTYHIKLKNLGSSAIKVRISDEAVSGTHFASSNYNTCVNSTSSNLLDSCIITINPYDNNDNNIKEVWYKLRVEEDFDGDYFIMDKTRIYPVDNDDNNLNDTGLTLTKTITYVGNRLTSELEDYFNTFSPRDTYTSSIEYINDVYKNLGISIGTMDDITNNLFVKNSNPTNINYAYGNNGPIRFCGQDESNTTNDCVTQISVTKRLNNTDYYDIYWPKNEINKYTQMQLPGMYGGIMTLDNYNLPKNGTSANFSRDIVARQRMRYVTLDDFMVGDVLIVNDYNIVDNIVKGRFIQAYIYLNGTLKYVDSTGSVISASEENVNNILQSLIGKANFAIIRPVNKPYITKYKINTNNYILDVERNTMAEDFNLNLPKSYSIQITGASNDLVTTNSEVKLYFQDQLVNKYTIIIPGDVDSTGKVDKNDYSKIVKHIIGKNSINDDIYFTAADYNKDGKIKMDDVMKLVKIG